MSSRSEDWPVGWKPSGTPSSSMASHTGSSSGSWTWRPLIGLGLPMTATAPSSRTARRLARGERRIVEGDLGGELQARGRVLTVLVRPRVVGARQRVGDARVEIVVHLHLTAARAIEDRDIDAFDVHRLHVRGRVVAARVRNLVMRRPRERATLEILAHGGGVRALGHLADLEVTDADERLVRGVFGAPGERRRERLERLVEVADPEVVGLHRVQIAVHDLEPVLHERSSGWTRS